MFGKKEAAHIIVAILVLSLAISIWNFEIILYALISVFFVVLINIIAKNISAYYFESEIENKIWETQRYGFKAHKYFKKPIPIGAFLPLITSIISLGYFSWFSSLVFDVKPKSYRAAKHHGLYSFSEMTEEHICYIAAFGILANLLLAVAGYLIGFELFAKLNIYYTFFNMLPISDLDGNKIFFGNIVLWSFLATLILIGLGYVFFIF
ncbi:MAG: hypothetical protein AABX84_02745 [Nanoarchaeota archaeon]